MEYELGQRADLRAHGKSQGDSAVDLGSDGGSSEKLFNLEDI